MKKSSNIVPHRHKAALAVCAIIDSCETYDQLLVAANCVKNFNAMYAAQWDWVYADDFAEALQDKQEELQ